jgi:hypothetical protein
MARTDVPVQRTSRLQVFSVATGTPGDVANGMRMINDGATLLYVQGAGMDATVSTILVETVDFQTPPPIVLTIPANSFGVELGPFPVDLYGSVLEFDVSDANLTFAAFTLF